MNIQDVVEKFRWELRNVQWPGEILEQSPAITRRTSSSQSRCELTCFAVNDENADSLIREEIVRTQYLKLDLEWKVFSFDFPDLVRRLKSAGFSVGEHEAMVVYDLSEGLKAIDEHARSAASRVVNMRGLDDYQAAYAAAFDKDCSTTVAQLAGAVKSGHRGHDAYVAYVDSMPASVGRLYTNPKSAFAGLYGGGTSPDFRGRGLYRSIVAARARDALVQERVTC